MEQYWAGNAGTPQKPRNQLDCKLYQKPKGILVVALDWPEFFVYGTIGQANSQQ